MNDVICIIGMHRSGTSMVARLLNLCGLYLGSEEQFVGPDAGNPTGHFEHKGFLKVNEALLTHFGGSSHDPPTLPERWENETSLGPILQEAEQLITTFDQNCPWGWKEPRTTILLPFWKKLIPRLRFVICVRNPLEVAHSLIKRDAMQPEKALHLWNLYMRAAIHDTDGCARTFTFYEDFFHEPRCEITKVLDFCGLRIPSDPSVVVSIISNDLRRNIVAPIDLLANEVVLPEYKLFYLGLRALSLDRAAPDKRDEIVAEGFGSLTALIDELRSRQKVAQLQTTLVERELLLKQMADENEVLRLSLGNFERTLTWQIMMKLDHVKETVLPRGTPRGKLYDQFLVGLKKLLMKERT